MYGLLANTGRRNAYQNGVVIMAEMFEVTEGRFYPVMDMVEVENGVTLPLVDIPMMSDEKWVELTRKNKERLGDQYDAIINDLK